MVSNARRTCSAPAAWPVAFAFAFSLSACSSTFDVLPEKMGGLPASAPQRAAEPLAFPNVYEQRPTREAKPLNDEEQKKLESELTTLREEQKQLANPSPPTPPPTKKAPPPPTKKAQTKKATEPAKEPPAKEEKKKKQQRNDAVVPEQKGPVAPPKMVN
jgi:outer membrane biosynthesis protein TonB